MVIDFHTHTFPDRVQFATDSHWNQAETLRQVRALPLSSEAQQAILSENASRILSLETLNEM